MKRTRNSILSAVLAGALAILPLSQTVSAQELLLSEAADDYAVMTDYTDDASDDSETPEVSFGEAEETTAAAAVSEAATTTTTR